VPSYIRLAKCKRVFGPPAPTNLQATAAVQIHPKLLHCPIADACWLPPGGEDLWRHPGLSRGDSADGDILGGMGVGDGTGGGGYEYKGIPAVTAERAAVASLGYAGEVSADADAAAAVAADAKRVLHHDGFASRTAPRSVPQHDEARHSTTFVVTDFDGRLHFFTAGDALARRMGDTPYHQYLTHDYQDLLRDAGNR